MLVELNEFSVELFEQASEALDLRNVRRLLAMPRSATTTDDAIEHHGLDPWVQWVSVHTGQASDRHGVMHLGDTPGKLGCRQLWEVLGDRGIHSGVWGAMNATRNDTATCDFFLPDPWTFSESAYPAELDDLLALPRYYARNYLDVSAFAFLTGCLRLARYLPGSGAMRAILRSIPLAARGILRNGVDNRVLFSLFDLFSTALFVANRHRHPVRFSLVFLNSIAHLQHHRWRLEDGLPADVAFAMRCIDTCLGMLFEDLRPGEAVVVMNALTQRNVAPDEDLVAYRQVNPSAFLDAAGFSKHRVEQLMTSDGHVFFATRADRDHAVEALSEARVDGRVLFQTEADPAVDEKLFYQVILWDALAEDSVLQVNGRHLPFNQHFGVLAHRTGAHVQHGDVFSTGLELPACIPNHKVFDHLLAFFQASPSADAGGVA
jgi:hypothetical protein